jgi:hypothetical protein
MLQDDPVNAGGGPGPAREHPHLPPLITPYSQLGTPVEPRPWWAPLGWLLVTLSSLLLLALFLALTPVLLPYVVGRRLWARRLRYHRRPEDLRIAVVGAGWAGLQCLDRFRALGVEQVDVFERYGEVGGTWGPHLRYHGLQIHGSMTVTSFDGFPYSDDPDVMAGKVMAEEVERYIHRFADARDLLPHCRFDANVEALSCSTADRTASLSLSNPKTGDTWTEGPYDLVVWASMAAHWRMPELPGSDRFRGRQVHTTHYSDGAFEDIVEQGRHVVGGRRRQGRLRRRPRPAAGRLRGLRVGDAQAVPVLQVRADAPRRLLAGGQAGRPVVPGDRAVDRAVQAGRSRPALVVGLPVDDGEAAPGLHPLPRRGAGRHAAQGPAGRRAHHRRPRPPHRGLPGPGRRARGAGRPRDLGDGNVSGIDTLALDKDGVPFSLRPDAKLYNHFVVPDLPVLASSTALWTTFGPMRATNAADLAVYHLCVRGPRTEHQMQRAADRQTSENSILRSFIWARDACWLQQWARFHVDLLLQGITPLDAFLKHALEIFVLAKETPLRFDLLPRRDAPAARGADAAGRAVADRARRPG